MNVISMTQARAHFAKIINKVSYKKARIKLKRQGEPLAAIVSLEDLQLLEEFEDKLDILAAKKEMKEIKKKGTKPLRQVIEERKKRNSNK